MSESNRNFDTSLFYLSKTDLASAQIQKLQRTAKLTRALSDAATVETNGDTLQDKLLGLSFGNDTLRRTFRTYYDQTTNKFRIQHNTGTDASPNWFSVQKIDPDGDTTIVGDLTAQAALTVTGRTTLGGTLDLNDQNVINGNGVTAGGFYSSIYGPVAYISDLLNVRELDDTPNVEPVYTIKFSHGTVKNKGSGTVSVRNAPIFKESEVGGFYEISHTVSFDSNVFYLSTDGDGFPLVSLKNDPSITTTTQKNWLLNASFSLWQDGTTRESTSTYPNNDAVYGPDMWVLLSDDNDVVDISRATTVPTAGYRSFKFDIETANKKFGTYQPMENTDTLKLRGKTMSFSFDAAITGSSIGAIRAAIIYWTGTADSITRDPISAWNAAGTNPTLATSWHYAKVASSLAAPSTSFQRFRLENVTIPTNANNLGIMVWVDDTTLTVGEFLYLATPMLNIGEVALAYEDATIDTDSVHCYRHYFKTFAPDTAPVDGVSASYLIGRGASVSADEPYIAWRFPVTMRTSPTVTLYNPRSGGTAGQWQVGAADGANARVLQVGVAGVVLDNTGVGLTAGSQCFIQAKADARL